MRVDEETLKNVVLHSVATALAKSVFPVPGGPTISTPYGKEIIKSVSVQISNIIKQITLKSLDVGTFQGLRMPLKNAGIHIGNTTASFRSFFASSKSAMLSLKK